MNKFLIAAYQENDKQDDLSIATKRYAAQKQEHNDITDIDFNININSAKNIKKKLDKIIDGLSQ